jgi:hypothetical protein
VGPTLIWISGERFPLREPAQHGLTRQHVTAKLMVNASDQTATHVSDLGRVSDKRLGKCEEKFGVWEKVSTTNNEGRQNRNPK